jgi:hypothetical protein
VWLTRLRRLTKKKAFMECINVHEICIKERCPLCMAFFPSFFIQIIKQAFLFLLEPMICCSVLPRPAVTVHVTRTRRRDGIFPAVVVYDVGVTDGAAVVESRRALGSEVVDGGRCYASLGDVDWRSRCEVASHGGCAALWDSFLRHGGARSAVCYWVEGYVAASGGRRVGWWWWRWCVWCGCL